RDANSVLAGHLEELAEPVDFGVEGSPQPRRRKRDLGDLKLLGNPSQVLKGLGVDVTVQTEGDRGQPRRFAKPDAEALWVINDFRNLELVLSFVHPEFDFVELQIVQEEAGLFERLVGETAG